MAALTGKAERFCQEYIIDYIGKEAAIRAGYAENSAKQQAYRLLQRPEIRDRVRQLQQEQVERLSVSQDFVVAQLMDVYQCCRGAKPRLQWDYETHEMVESGEYAFDSKGSLKALDMLGKHLGMFDKNRKTQDKPKKLEDLI